MSSSSLLEELDDLDLCILLLLLRTPNFWLSNNRIQIECTFGEVVMHWGFLWRKLLFDIQDVGKVVTAAVLLHNFFVLEEQESDLGFNSEDADYCCNFSLRELHELAVVSSEAPSSAVVATDNNEPHPGGTRTNASMAYHQARGKELHEQQTDEMYGSFLMDYNAYG